MKILMIHPHDIYSTAEPWTVRITNLAREFVLKGHSVKLIYYPLHDEKTERRPLPGIEVIEFSRKIGWGEIWRNIKKILPLACWADIIHLQKCFHYAVIPAVIGSWIYRKPLHYDWDDWEAKIYFQGGEPPSVLVGLFLDLLETLLPRISDSGSFSSYRIRELFIERGLSPDLLVHAPVGADIATFLPDNQCVEIREKYGIKKYLVMYVGQLHGGQYAELFIKAAHSIIKERDDVDFMIVGGGYRLEELQRMAKDMGMDSKLFFTGALIHSEVPRYISSCDIGVACFEDNDITRCKSPLKIVEYLASGKPIVASNVGEVRRMVGGAGLLVAPGDSEALSRGILKLLDQPVLRERMGKQARLRAEDKFNWRKTAENILGVYSKVLENI